MSTIPLTPQQTATAELQASKEGYIHRVAVALDQFMNVVADGLPDETISARAERDAIKGEILEKVLTHGLDLIQAQHGQKAQAGDLERAKAITQTEDTSGTIPAS